jgi:single-strand DNA-binding protein
MNKVILIGNIGSDPKVKELENGTKVVNMSIATNDYYTDKNGDSKQDTEWHKLVLWGNKASIAETYLTKGIKVCIIGKIQTRSYEKDGEKVWTTSINVDEFNILEPKKKSA